MTDKALSQRAAIICFAIAMLTLLIAWKI